MNAFHRRPLSRLDRFLIPDGVVLKRRTGAGPAKRGVLVVLGFTAEGRKEILDFRIAHGESQAAWEAFLADLYRRGLRSDGLDLIVTDGGRGLLTALPFVYAHVALPHCRVYKTADVLDKMPKSAQPRAKAYLQAMSLAPMKKAALKAYGRVLCHYEAKYDKTCECLKKDKEVLFAFYDFSAPHGVHIRSINPIGSTFATVRHSTKRMKGCGPRYGATRAYLELDSIGRLARNAMP